MIVVIPTIQESLVGNCGLNHFSNLQTTRYREFLPIPEISRRDDRAKSCLDWEMNKPSLDITQWRSQSKYGLLSETSR